MPVEGRVLDDWIDGFLNYMEYNQEPPLLFKMWTAISTVAAVLQRKCFLPWEGNIYPNMYIVLIGPPACGKGTAMRPAMDLLKTFGAIALAPEATSPQKLIRELKQSGRMHVDPRTDDSYFHASLTIHNEELVVFLGHKNTDMISILCNWYDCLDTWSYHTKHQGEDNVIGVFVNMLGATTPELLQSSISVDAIGSGLPSRIIFVFESKRGAPTPKAFITEKERDIRERLLADLDQMYKLAGPFRLTKPYLEAYTNWYMAQARGPTPILDSRFSGYCGRRATHLRKLSMIVNASRSNTMVIDVEDFNRALHILEITEKKMPLTFAAMGRSQQATLINEITLFLTSVGEATMTDLMRHFYRDADPRTFDSVIRQMRDMRIISINNDGRGTETVKFLKAVGGKERGAFDLHTKENEDAT